MRSEHAHLGDDQLIEACVLSIDSPHLRSCARCQARMDEIGTSLGNLRDTGVYEADEVFTRERLHDQRDRIVRRLERQGLPAELLMFPTRSQRPVSRRVIGPAQRWIAGAAAAGLAAGVFLGFAVDRRVVSIAAPRPIEVHSASTARDEQILSEIEDALMGPRGVLELRALDVMTIPADLQEASFDIR